MLMSSFKLFFFERSLFRLRCETVIGIVLCCCHQACCPLYFLGEINNAIHTNQFTFEPLHLCSVRMWLLFGLNKNIGGSTDLAKKRHGAADLHIPIHVLLLKYSEQKKYFETKILNVNIISYLQ